MINYYFMMDIYFNYLKVICKILLNHFLFEFSMIDPVFIFDQYFNQLNLIYQ